MTEHDETPVKKSETRAAEDAAAGLTTNQEKKVESGVLDKRGPTLVIHGNDIVMGNLKDLTPKSLGAASLNTDLINHAVIPPLAIKNGIV